MNTNLTIEDVVIALHNEARNATGREEGASELADALEQIIDQPKTIQLVTIDETLIALKDDGTIWSSMGGNGINWKVLPLPK